MKVRVEKQIGKSVLSFETGLLAKQAAAAVVAQYAETVVLCAVATGPARPGLDFFPLTCDYRERVSAAGKFPGGFIKREGRPTLKETLTSRLIDRPLRPLFAEGFGDEVQVQSLVLSSDRQNDSDLLAMNGSAAAVHISPLPFHGPIASVRVGRVDGQWMPFPTQNDLEESDLDLIVSGSEQAILMIEGFAREMPEDDMLAALQYGHQVVREICAMQRELYEKVAVQKAEFVAHQPHRTCWAACANERMTSSAPSSRRPASRPARRPSSALKERIKDEFIPDPSAEGALDPLGLRSCLARAGIARRCAI